MLLFLTLVLCVGIVCLLLALPAYARCYGLCWGDVGEALRLFLRHWHGL